MTETDDYDFEIKRKPDPKPDFVCAICKKPYTYRCYSAPQEYQLGPVCPGCTWHWGYSNTIAAVRATERLKLMKLAALVNALDWQVKNARSRQ